MVANTAILIGCFRFYLRPLTIVSLSVDQQRYYSIGTLLLSKHTMMLMERSSTSFVFFEMIKIDFLKPSDSHRFHVRSLN